MIRLAKSALLPTSAAAFVAALAVWLTGGLELHAGDITLRARDPWRPLIAGCVLLILELAINRERWVERTTRAGTALSKASGAIVVLAMAALCAHAVWFGPRVAGASDPYGYVSQAYGWLRGDLPRPIELLTLPFPSSDWLQIPLGYRPGPLPHTMVPTYAPGLPLLMAAAALPFGRFGVFLVVPASAALLVWAVGRWARAANGSIAGALAALIVATSPIVLFQAILPMSDVPAAAFWTSAGALALQESIATALLAGVSAAAGLLVRPNLLPLVAVLFVGVLLMRRRRAVIAALAFLAPVVIAAVFVGWLNWRWYGSPLRSGYGANAELYAWSNIAENIRRYPLWFWQSQSPGSLIGLLPLLPVFGRRTNRAPVRLAIGLILTTLACYLPYAPFDVWWYLRFLLPAMGAVAVLIGVGVTSLGRAVPSPWGGVAALAAMILTVVTTIRFAAAHDTFGLIRDGERRFAYLGAFVAASLPQNAVLFAVEHSGALRLYGGRYTFRYDDLDANSAPTTLRAITQAGLHPFLVADDEELPDVRRHFGLASGVPVPWPIFARMRDLGGVNVFDMTGDPAAAHPTALEPTGLDWCPPILTLKPPVFDAR